MTYLKLGEAQSKNEVAQIAWQNFYNTVSHTLNLAPELRENPQDFLAKMTEAYNRLFEISPICSRRFILAVKKRVRQHANDEFQVPPYMNGFKHTNVWNDDESDDGEERQLEHEV